LRRETAHRAREEEVPFWPKKKMRKEQLWRSRKMKMNEIEWE
jgi:hypothetical protein